MFFTIYKKISRSLYGSGLSKIPIVRKTHRKMIEKFKPDIIDIFGFKMILDKKDESGHSIINLKELDLFKKHIKLGDVVVDVGANIGFYTLLFASLVGPTGKVIAFEPVKENFELLSKNIDLNKLNNVELHQNAVGSYNSKVKMKLSESIGRHQISENGDYEVECVRLDDCIKFADFVKIDVEGYETNVLIGMKNLLSQKLTIISEFYLKLLKQHGDPGEFFKIIQQNGFVLYDVRNKMLPVDVFQILEKYEKEHIATDILCIKQ